MILLTMVRISSDPLLTNLSTSIRLCFEYCTTATYSGSLLEDGLNASTVRKIHFLIRLKSSSSMDSEPSMRKARSIGYSGQSGAEKDQRIRKVHYPTIYRNESFYCRKIVHRNCITQHHSLLEVLSDVQ